MKVTSYSLIAALAAIAPFGAAIPAQAQFNQQIAVDGRYVPEIIPIDRINSFPRRERFELSNAPLAYDTQGVAAAFAPQLVHTVATGWRSTRRISDRRGYLDLGAGSWLNSNLSAGYRFIQTDRSVLGVRLQHNSTSLWKPEISKEYADTKEWRYDESIGVYGSHIFDGAGRLEGAVDYHIGNFNYYGFAPSWAGIAGPDAIPNVPDQTLNDVAARFGWQSESRTDDISWSLAAGVRYFGYRRFYMPGVDQEVNTIKGIVDAGKSTRETDINISAGLNFPTSAKSAVGIDLNADLLFYSGSDGYYAHGSSPSNRAETDAKPLLTAPDNYGMVTLTPYYRFIRDRLNVRIGVDIDIAARAGAEGNRYSTFHFAPDISLDLNAGAAQLYLHLLGGSRLNTLAAGYDANYYQQPFLTASATRPVYNPLDGSFGANFGPFSGFSAGVEFAFRVSKGQYLGGWYQELLNNYGWIPATGLPEMIGSYAAEYNYLASNTMNIHGFSLGANVAYDFGKILSLKGKVNYQPQNGSKGYFNGFDRPRWVVSASAETNPWKTLKLRLGYDYRGVREIYTTGRYFAADKGVYRDFETSRRLPDLTWLNFGATYAFSDSFDIRVQADNLLNRHDETLPGLPSQGLTLSAGLGFLF